MTDKWRRIRALFEAAVERPEGERQAFIAAQAGDDEEMRHEVESLVASDAADAQFLDWIPPAAHAVIAEPPLALTPPCRIGPFEVVAVVGVGAMGEVYRARDSKLNRDVALKVLPPTFARDPDRLSRFQREAQVLAAMNHPNIAAIYEFEEAIGAQALVLEFVDGPTLADRITRGPIALSEALAIARQITEALEAAHEKGVVHRDLKPANIKIDGSGVVKVLDFGLAKPVDTSDARPDLTGSHSGLILGTASYMSPEQARGQSVDKRADIWAFGCVLYEMLTGQLAFPGDTVSDTIAKILEREPDWSALPPTTPTPIRRLLGRCLAKDLRQRMRDIGDVRLEIDAVGSGSDGAGDYTDDRRILGGRRAWAVGGTVGVVAVAFLLIDLLRPAAAPENPLANAKFTLLTNWEGAEEGADISPDGRFVAFLSDHEREFDLWLTQVGSGRFSNLTRSISPLGASGIIVRKLGFSGAATDIWFNASDGKPLMLMPLTGGPPRPFLRAGANTPAWSPDANRIVYVYKPNRDDPMYVTDRTGTDLREILPPGSLKNINPAWSPDGEWIYFVRGAEPQDEIDIDLWRMPAAGGTPERLTEQHAAVNFPAPIDARTVLYVARDEDWSGPWLWAIDVETRIKRRVPTGSDQYTSIAASRDGRRIVATVVNPSATLWRVPLLAAVAGDRDVDLYPLPVPSSHALAPRFGGNSLFYLSAHGSGEGLWKITNNEASEVWSNADGALFEPAVVSPDGNRVAVIVRQQGKRRLAILSADGTNRRTLAQSIEVEGAAGQSAADWSPDGQWIVIGGRDAQGPALFKIAVDGTALVRLVDGNWVNPIWSPTDDLIVYAGRSIVGQVALHGVRSDGTPIKLPELMVRPGGYRFLRDGSGLVYLPRIQALDFWLVDFATNATRQITNLGNRGTLRTFDISPDGKYIVFDRARQNSNIVLIERSSD